jgi:ABC-2 type transport system ATP-binding protein
VLLLDEPLNGLDPVQRRHVVELIRRSAPRAARSLVSSHVLPEGRAHGAARRRARQRTRSSPRAKTGAIRDLIRDRPRTVRIAAGADAQALARELVGEGLATGVQVDTGELVVETADVRRARPAADALARDLGATLERVEPLGDDLESVYTVPHRSTRAAGGAER